jgi:hypothetical protein
MDRLAEAGRADVLLPRIPDFSVANSRVDTVNE